MMMMRYGAAAALLTCAISCASDPVAPASIAVTVNAASLSLMQGATVNVPVTVIRLNFAGPVGFQLTGLPAGVSAAADSLPANATSATIVLSATSTAAPGEVTVTLTAGGNGIESQAASIPLTVDVTGSYGITAPATPVSITREDAVTASVGISRLNGFAQTVVLTASDLPAGVSASFMSTGASAESVTMTLLASASAAVGSATVTVTGRTPGLGDVTTTFPLEVIASPPTTPVSIDFCESNVPTWIATRNQGGAWSRVQPNGSNGITFDATPKVSLAYVYVVGDSVDIQVRQVARSELAHLEGATCPEAPQVGLAAGSLTLVTSDVDVLISVDTMTGRPAVGNTAYTMFGPAGVRDIVAHRSPWMGGLHQEANVIVVQRDVSFVSDAPAPSIDFDGPDAFAPARPTVTITGMPAGFPATLINRIESRTANSLSATRHAVTHLPYTAPMPISAMPEARLSPQDRQYVVARASEFSGRQHRGVSLTYRSPVSMTLEMGPNVDAPATSTVAMLPYRRHQVAASAVEYTGAARAILSGPKRSLSLYVSASYTAMAPAVWELTTPDFSSVDGWNDAWVLSTDPAVAITLYSEGVLPFTEREPRAADNVELRWATYQP